jgi:Major capsid protein Gp23
MKLIENWQETKDALLEGLQGSKKSTMNTLLENQKAYLLTETASAPSTVAGAIGNFQNITIPMIRRILPGTISSDLVGVQPMTGPVGLAYSLRLAFGEAADATGPNVVAGNDIVAGDEAFGQYGASASKMKRFYSSADVGTTSYPPALTAATSDGFAATTANYEGFGGKAMRLSVLKQTISAGSRKLQARWTQEAAQDLNSQHGLDLESELTAALAAQIAHETDNEILTDLLQLAGSVATFDFAAPAAGFAPNFLGDRYANLGVLVNKMANEIGAKTRRGPGNWLVGGHLITSMLQSAAKSVFAPAVSGSFSDATGNKLVGVMNGQMKVYSYNWGLNDAYQLSGSGAGVVNAEGAVGEDVLIGYKGGASELDSGYFYCPYIPLMSTGMVMDGQNFTPAVSLSTRYAKATFTNNTTSLGNSADYYARILVKNVAFS